MDKFLFFVLYHAELKKILLLMRVVIIFIFLSVGLLRAGDSYSQNALFSLKMKNTTVKEVLGEIERNSEFIFIFTDHIIDLNRKLSIDIRDKTIDQVLTELFRHTDNEYEVMDRQIIIMKKDIPAGKEADKPDEVRQATSYTIRGYLTDSLTTEALISGTVYDKITLSGTTSNQYGFYSLTLPAGEVDIVYSYVGYTTKVISIKLVKDTVINTSLSGILDIEEVVVTAQKAEKIQNRTQMSVLSLPVAQIKSLPALLGETDVLKVLQLMPGVQSGGEGTSGLYVRGGGPDQNLILLDGVPVYNASHMFGFFSIFNADAINNVEMLKGAFPARYGGRISSVLDIYLKEGNMQKFSGEGSVGLVSTKFTFEGPVWKDRTSFIVSGRRTYIDALTRPLMAISNRKSDSKNVYGYYFYDLTAKINHKISDRDRIYLSAYAGDDKFYIKDKTKIDVYNDHQKKEGETKTNSDLKWGNITTALRYNRVISNKLFGNLTFTFGRYRLHNVTESREKYKETDLLVSPPVDTMINNYYGGKYNSGILDWAGKVSFDYIPSARHYIRWGAGTIYHTFEPGAMNTKEGNLDFRYGGKKVYTLEYNAYIEDDLQLTRRLKANIGIHWSGFNVRNRFYHIWQPRLALRHLITDQISVKASYSRMGQYIHLLTNSTIGLPTDLWIPATDRIDPQVADQVALGYAHQFKKEYEISVEAYYKDIRNVVEYMEGASFFEASDDWENKIIQGKGRSYGMEFFVQKKTGSFTGWIGYTLSWTDRKFGDINEGRRFPYKYDRRNDLSIVLIKRLKDHIELSGSWVFGTGNCVTLPVGIYEGDHPITGKPPRFFREEIKDYGGRNSYRMAAYHRLDLSISFIKAKKWGERRWVFGLYNAYNRKNPFYIDIESAFDKSTEKIYYKYVQYTLFPVIPSVSYQFKF
ncbi:MAG: TonB-dependent receptor [Bacteroidales bacterium]|jgi:hypothetical protein|nr:TonB-dependent receptor [Bacteroidales bacterium]